MYICNVTELRTALNLYRCIYFIVVQIFHVADLLYDVCVVMLYCSMCFVTPYSLIILCLCPSKPMYLLFCVDSEYVYLCIIWGKYRC